MSSNCLRAPNGFCQRGIPLEYLFFSFTFIPFFSLLSGASTLAAVAALNARASPQALSSSSANGALLFGSENDATFGRKGKKRKEKKIVDCIRVEGKKDRNLKAMLLNVLSYQQAATTTALCARDMFIMCR